MPKSLKSTHGWHCQGVFFTSWGLWKSYKTPCTLSGLDPDQGASHEVDFRDTSVGDTNEKLVPLLSWRVTNSPILLINPCGVASIYIFLILFSTCFVTPGRIEPHDWEPFCIIFGSLASAKNHSEIGGQKHLIFIHGKVPENFPRWKSGGFHAAVPGVSSTFPKPLSTSRILKDTMNSKVDWERLMGRSLVGW